MKRLLVMLACVALAVPLYAQDVAPVLESLRPTYPTPMSKAQLSDMLNRAASQRPGWGMLRKDHGNNCPTPYPGISISCDWMVHGPTRWGYDILSDQENAARVVRGDGEALGAGMEIVYPWPTEAPPTPPAPPQVPPVVVPPGQPPPVYTAFDYARIEAAIAAVYQQNERVRADADAQRMQIGAKLDAIAAQVKQHDEKTSAITSFFSNRFVQMLLTSAGTVGALVAAK